MPQACRVAGVGITPPEYKASGGISAGLQLMRQVAEHLDTTMYLMAEHNEDVRDQKLTIVRRRPTNVLWSLRKILPRQVVTLGWRAPLSAWLEQYRPSIVHFHNPHPPGALLCGAIECRRLGIPYVVSTHGFVEFNDIAEGFNAPKWQQPLLRRFVREPICEVVRNAARVLMLSPLEESILLSMGAQKEQLDVVSNGVDSFFLEPIEDDERRRLISRFELPSDRVLLLFVGNHTSNKGLDVLMAAVRQMALPVTAVIAGAIRSRHEHLAFLKANNVEEGDARIVFTDFVSKDELRALYRTVDVFVFPSRADTLPLVILEAMASGLPVVASRVGGIPYEVTPDTGVLVDPGDHGELASALEALCNQPDHCKRLAVAGRDRVRRMFDWRVAAEKCLRIYADVLRRS